MFVVTNREILDAKRSLNQSGRYRYKLDFRRAAYVGLTGEPDVGRSHAYLEGSMLKNNRDKRFFTRAFNGQRAEDALVFDSAMSAYRLSS